MQISPPFGYKDIVPFRKDQKVVLPAAGVAPAFGRAVNVMPISYSEFVPASRDYPVVFASGDGGKSFANMIVLGMRQGQNLFVGEDGSWNTGFYSPAYVRRYPFCMARLANVEQDQRIVCVESAAVADSGEAMFDAEGQPTEKWAGLEKLLHEYEADLERSNQMCRIVSDYGLLEPFTMRAELKGGGTYNLTGMWRVDEKKLEHLTAEQLRNLIRKGILGRIYLHLASLENFQRLLARVADQSGLPRPAGTERRRRGGRRKGDAKPA